MKVNLVTLCSGIEAQGQALRNLCNEHPELEWELVVWREIDKDAIAAHNAIFPEYADRNLGDMTTCDYSKITQPIDCLFYSTPCQSVSQAGKNKGMKDGTDAASALIWHTRRAIESLKPKICILENVKGMIMGENLREFHKWQAVMESYGYTNYTKVLDSKDYGTAQHRERVFMVSILGDEKYYFPDPFKLEKRIKDYLEPYGSVPESFYLTPKHLYNVIAHCEKKQKEGCGFRTKFEDENGICGTILTAYGNRPTDAYIKEPAIIGYTRSRDGKITSVHLKDTANTIHTFTGSGFTTDQYVAESALFNPMPDGTCRTLKAQYARIDACNHYRLFEKVPTEGQYSTPDNIVLVDEDGKGYLLKDGWIWRVRKLTPLETFRLQGVSDEDAKKIIATVSK